MVKRGQIKNDEKYLDFRLLDVIHLDDFEKNEDMITSTARVVTTTTSRKPTTKKRTASLKKTTTAKKVNFKYYFIRSYVSVGLMSVGLMSH